jgi:L-fucose mutarotase/ribose pyranase (RbsD/FucU family)
MLKGIDRAITADLLMVLMSMWSVPDFIDTGWAARSVNF